MRRFISAVSLVAASVTVLVVVDPIGSSGVLATTTHNLTIECTSSGGTSTVNVLKGDTIVVSTSTCGAINKVFTDTPTGIWTSSQIDYSAGTATFPATITTDANASGDFLIRLIVQGDFSKYRDLSVRFVSLPYTPSNITATVGDAKSTLKWTGGSDGSGLTYEIEKSTDNKASWTSVATGVASSAATNGYEVTGLTNGVPHFFRIRGTDNLGTGQWGEMSTAVTPSLPPPAPTSVVATAGDAQATLSWTAPNMTGYAPLTGYKIEKNDGSSWTTAVSDTGNTNTSSTVTGLTNGVSHTFRVSGINAAGSGAASTASPGVVPFTVPNGVDGMFDIQASLAPNTTDTLDLSWTAPNDNGRPIVEYQVQIAEAQSPNFATPGGGTCAAANLSTTTCSISGLTQGTTYEIQIRARNEAGWGSFGNSKQATVPGPAGAPQNPQATPGDTQVSVSWGLPTSWGGPMPTQGFSYDIERSVAGANAWLLAGSVTIPGLSQMQPQFPATSSLTITGLMNGTSYDFRVSAVTLYGNGLWASVTAVTPSTIPANVSAPVATRGDQQALLSWTAPNDGGSPITGYLIEKNDGTVWSTVTANTNSTATTYTATGLTNGTSYTFRITAINANGSSAAPSSSSNSVTPASLPGTPSGLSAIHGNGQVTLAWTPGSSSAALTGHFVEISSDGGANWTTAIADTGSAAGSATITGLTNGNPYVFRVSGISSAGTGLPLTLANAVTPSTTPGAVTGLAAQVGDQQVALSWTAPASNGGSTITGYVIEKNDGTGWTQVTANTNSSTASYTVTGLTNGTAYDFRVTPININGASVSAPPNLTNPVSPIAAPGVPPAPTAVAGAGSATITVAAGTGGDPSSFTVTALNSSNQPSGSCTVTGASGSCTITGLTAGTAYTFTATATNANTTSAASVASASVTPTAPPASSSGVIVPPSSTAPPTSQPGDGSSSAGGRVAGDREVVDGGTRPATPIPSPDGGLPELEPGRLQIIEDGRVVAVDVISTETGGLLMTSDDFTLGLEVTNGVVGSPGASSGVLTLTPSGGLNVRGSGFVPGSIVDVWLFSTPTFVGTVVVGDDGTFSGTLVVPVQLAPGDHTLQANGVSSDGLTRSLNLGVEVVPNSFELPVTGGSSRAMDLSLWLLVAGTFALVLRRRRGWSMAN